MPVAGKVIGLFVSVPDVAVIVLLPAIGPSVQVLSVASPDASVVIVAPLGEETEPPPVATANVTLTQGTYVGTGPDADEQLAAALDRVRNRAGEAVPPNGSAQGANEFRLAKSAR